MAFDLVGRISIKDDGASKTINRVSESVQRAAKIQSSLTRATDRLKTEQSRASSTSQRLKTVLRGVGNSANFAGNQMHSASRGASSLVRSVSGLAAAYVGARTAAGLFNKTIGAAADYEMKEVTVNAMFGKSAKANAQKYLDFVQGRAAVSMFSVNDFLTAGKSFIPTTKDNAKLQKMVNLAERLGAIDPEQGIEGAAYALKEFFSGDAVSLVERFELPRKAMNAIKNLPLDKQLQALDKFLNGIGATNELINAQADTTLGQYRKAVAGVNRAFREMGTEALKKVNPLLRDFNKYLSSADFKNLKTWGVDAFSGLVSGAIDAVRRASDYVNKKFIHNPEFQKLPDVKSKIRFIFDSLMDDFNVWMENSGKSKLEELSRKTVDTVAGAMKASQPLIDAAIEIGKSIGSGLLQGIMSDPTLALILSGGVGAKLLSKLGGGKKAATTVATTAGSSLLKNPYVIGGASLAVGAGAEASLWENLKSNPNSMYSSKVLGGDQPTTKKILGPPMPPKKITSSQVDVLADRFTKGHAGGLDNVPYNGYPARLHKGEEVLTRTEAQRHREEKSGGSSRPFKINIQKMYVRNDADIELIADSLARRLEF